MGFVVLFLVTVAMIVGFLAALVAQEEAAECEGPCADRPTSYWAALYWLLSQLTFRGDPHGLSPATSQAQIAGLLMVLLGMTLIGVVLAAGVQIARIYRGHVGKLGEHVAEALDGWNRAAYGTLFINYRQEPERRFVGAVGLVLARHFGPDKVFLDTRSIRGGERYPDELREKLAACTVLLAMIHRDWLRELTKRRNGPGIDWVRYEIRMALETGKAVIPVLLDDAILPQTDELRGANLADLADVAHRQACRLRWTSLEADLDQLITVIEAHLRVRPARSG